jgi:hypothetical protein
MARPGGRAGVDEREMPGEFRAGTENPGGTAGVDERETLSKSRCRGAVADGQLCCLQQGRQQKMKPRQFPLPADQNPAARDKNVPVRSRGSSHGFPYSLSLSTLFSSSLLRVNIDSSGKTMERLYCTAG